MTQEYETQKLKPIYFEVYLSIPDILEEDIRPVKKLLYDMLIDRFSEENAIQVAEAFDGQLDMQLILDALPELQRSKGSEGIRSFLEFGNTGVIFDQDRSNYALDDVPPGLLFKVKAYVKEDILKDILNQYRHEHSENRMDIEQENYQAEMFDYRYE